MKLPTPKEVQDARVTREKERLKIIEQRLRIAFEEGAREVDVDLEWMVHVDAEDTIARWKELALLAGWHMVAVHVPSSRKHTLRWAPL